MLVYRSMRYLPRFSLLACLLAWVAFMPAAAQTTREEAQHTLDVLQDPAKRDQLIETLKTIAQVQPPSNAPAELKPNSLGSEVLVGASGFLNQLSDQLLATVGAIRSIPLL